jgi:hypothetical protein
MGEISGDRGIGERRCEVRSTGVKGCSGSVQHRDFRYSVDEVNALGWGEGGFWKHDVMGSPELQPSKSWL